MTPSPKAQREYNREFPGIRYVGSKRRLMTHLAEEFSKHKFRSALDLFSGSGCVSWLLKSMGKKVTSNDFLYSSSQITKALLGQPLPKASISAMCELSKLSGINGKCTDVYSGVLFDKDDSMFLDAISRVWGDFPPEAATMIRASIAVAATKKRPRGLYTQSHYHQTLTRSNSDDGKPLREIFLRTVQELRSAQIRGKVCKTLNMDAREIVDPTAELIYLDPPYPSKFSDANYLRRYHFLEGYLRGWEGVKIDFTTKSRQVRMEFPRLDDRETALFDLKLILRNFPKAHWLLSLSSNSTFPKDTIISAIRSLGRKVDVTEIEICYSHGTKSGTLNNQANELLFSAAVK